MNKKDLPVIPSDRSDDLHNLEIADSSDLVLETLPSGLELKQILSGGAIFGDKIGSFSYLHNRLTLMVVKGNPARIHSVTDLARDDVRISQPDPENEDIAFRIMEMYRQAGGDRLVHRIMEEKRAEGTTIFTVVHHRETPLRIEKKTVDVGPVWATEVIHAKVTSGLAFDVVEPGEEFDQRDRTKPNATGVMTRSSSM